MGDADDHSMIIDLPKRRNQSLKFKTSLKKREKITTQKTLTTELSDDSVRRNSVSGKNPLRVNAFTKEGIFLLYKLYTKKQEQIKNEENSAISIYDQYKIVTADLRKRLHVDFPNDNVHAIKDVDVDFFSFVRGRPYFHYAPPFKSLRYLFSKQMRLNQKLGYTKDRVLNIIHNHRKEEETYKGALKQYDKQSKLFDKFISTDYHNSMKYLIKCDELGLEVNKKIAELQNLAIEKFNITSRLIGLNYLYTHYQKYGRFLYYLSPPLWRLKNREFARSVEIEAKGFDFRMSCEEDTFNEIFENMKKECAGGLIRPALYFTHSGDLMKTFAGIEKQQLHHFSHVIQMAPHIKSLKDRTELLKDFVAKDTAGVLNNINWFEKRLTFYDDVCSQLKATFFRFLYGSVFDDVGSFEVLKLKLHLEFCYEKVYLDKPINMDIVSLTRALEMFYLDYNKRLDAIHSEKIKVAVLHNLQIERNKFRRAKVAARELQLFCRLERSLQRAYAPVVENHSPVLPAIKSISTRKTVRRVHSQVNINKTKLSQLTEVEREYLTLFTDWTENEDPANYLQRLKVSVEEKLSLH